MKFLEVGQLLKNSNVFIGNTAVIYHSTFLSKEMTNKVEDSTEIQIANGLVIKIILIGDMKGMLCNALGNELTVATFTKVRCSLANTFSLFLITKKL